MEGWDGWDDYAPFYDWENARTVGRRDTRFWQGLAGRSGGPVLELGCGTGRVSVPVARTVDGVVGIDRSAPMLRQAQRRHRRSKGVGPLGLVRGDIRSLPFRGASRFRLVMAPYGVLQSLLRDRDLRDTLRSVFAVLRRGGTFAIDLVPDLERWREYDRRVSLRGRRRGGATRISLIESVRQDRPRQLTIFDIHPRAVDPTRLCSSHHRPGPNAVTPARADVSRAGGPCFQGIPSTPLLICVLALPSRHPCTRRASACRDR